MITADAIHTKISDDVPTERRVECLMYLENIKYAKTYGGLDIIGRFDPQIFEASLKPIHDILPYSQPSQSKPWQGYLYLRTLSPSLPLLVSL